jgi:hypothetical protein
MIGNPPESLLPGAELVEQGLADLNRDEPTDLALLVLIASPRLKRLGLRIPERFYPRPYEHGLYDRLNQRLGSAAHSYYNSLLRRIASYAAALEREQSGSTPPST